MNSSSSATEHTKPDGLTETPHSAGQWKLWSERPEPLRRIIALYDDGSGSRHYFHADDGVIFDGEDGCEYRWEDRDDFVWWSYLPASYRFWVEDCEDPMTFPAESGASSPSDAGASAGNPVEDEHNTPASKIVGEGEGASRSTELTAPSGRQSIPTTEGH